MNCKERMQAVFAGERPDRVPTGELGVDYPITEHILGRKTFYRAKLHEKRALWEGRRDEVVASQRRDLVDLALMLGWDWIPVFLTYGPSESRRGPTFIDGTSWKDEYGRTWKYSEVTEDILCVEMPQPDAAALEVLESPFTAWRHSLHRWEDVDRAPRCAAVCRWRAGGRFLSRAVRWSHDGPGRLLGTALR
jgi:hypothetical protein